MPAMPRPNALWIVLISALLAFAFLGTRGLWDPDEGRYTNVALNMLDSGDWLNPRRSDDIGHWTKPPLTYWAIAASVAVFGQSAFAARLPSALAYLLCVWLTWRIARRIAPGSQDTAALVYATMGLTAGASQMITTDYLLSACITLAMWGFVEARFGTSPQPRRWIVLMWVGFALAFVTKGPAALLPLPVALLFDHLMPGRRERRVLSVAGIALFVVLALPWYVAVIYGNPGLFQYFVGDEVINRVTTNEFGRHGEWYGWIEIYVPTLLLGTLPWTPALLRWARALPPMVRSWYRDAARRRVDAPWLLLTLWLLLPLLVYILARSRMPLYLLPLFVPIALIIAMQRAREGRALPAWRWLVVWVALLLAFKLATAWWPTHKNAEAWAQAIRERADGPVHEVVFVEDMARYGLHLYLGTGTHIEKIALVDTPQPRFNPAYDESLAAELAEREPGVVWICKEMEWPMVNAHIDASGYRATLLGTPYQRRVMFRVDKAP